MEKGMTETLKISKSYGYQNFYLFRVFQFPKSHKSGAIYNKRKANKGLTVTFMVRNT